MAEMTFSGLGPQVSGAGIQVRASDPGPAPAPEHPNLIPDGRDLGPESASHFCTFAQAVGRFALLHLGQHVVLSPSQLTIRSPVSLGVSVFKQKRAPGGAEF